MSLVTLLLFVAGLVLLLVGAELLVKGASRLAALVGISPLVIGLTVVAFGTSAPELAVSVQGAWTGAADVALGIPGSRDWDDELTKARAALNWEKHFELAFDSDVARAFHDEDLDVDTDFCAMCGHDWCSVRISKEITAFASGKDEAYQWDKPKVTAALSEEQKHILQRRGVLSPDELHRLASKTKKAVAQSGKKASCHSDYVDDVEGQRLQEKLVQISSRSDGSAPASA